MKKKSMIVLLLTMLQVCMVLAQRDPSKEVLVFFSKDVGQTSKTIKGKSLAVAQIKNETLKASLLKFGIAEDSLEVALPQFKQSDTLRILTDGRSVSQADMTKLFRLRVPKGKSRQEIVDQLRTLPEVLYAEPNGKITPCIAPSDLRYGEQWGLHNVFRPGADIHAEAAWDIYTGNLNNIIAIIDGGVDINHPDLNDKISGADNGWGWDGHGIFVSGIAAAESNNAQGISGVDWNARIHGQRVDNVDDAGTYSAIVDAVNYSSNVRVLNNSWVLTDENDNPGRYSTTVRMAFAYAYKANRTSVVVMGNHQITHPNVVAYPSGFDKVIAIGATDMDDLIWNGSAHGNHIDVVAPGVGILSTASNNGYMYGTGTSAAAPFVSGIASLLRGYNANLSNDDIENIIRLSADDRGDAGFDNVYGFGRANAERALNLLRAPNSFNQWAATGGTIASSTGNYVAQFLGASGLASGNYIVKRYEVRKNITFPQSFCQIIGAWGRGVSTTGWSQANPNFGEGHCNVVQGTLTNTGVTLATNVYQIWTTSGQSLGYYPTTPANVTFAYSVCGILNPTGTILGPTLVCSSGAAFTVENMPAGCTVSWNKSPNLTLLGASGNGAVFASNGYGSSGWVQPTIVSGVCSNTLPQYSVWAGPPYIDYIQGPTTVQQNLPYTYHAQPEDYRIAGTYYWYVYPSYDTYTTSLPQADIAFSIPGLNSLIVTAQNACGWDSHEPNLEVEVWGNYYLSLSPNPASDNVEVTLTDSVSNNVKTLASSHAIRITNNNGIPVYSAQKTGNRFTLSTASLRDGLYIVEVNDGKNVYRKQLVVKH